MTSEQRVIQAQEIGKVQWFDYESTLQNIRPHNVERREIFKHANAVIQENLFNLMMVSFNSQITN
jgi:NADH pyrophosphatase NudC (nudix superfamily)